MQYLLLFLFGLAPPANLRVFDTPNDAGKSITICWQPSSEEGVSYYEISRRGEGEQEFQVCGISLPTDCQFIDDKVLNGKVYCYKVVAVKEGERAESEISQPVIASPQWFATNRINVLIGVIFFSFLLLYFIYHARKGKQLFIRRISGLDAVEEAVGRATEMGKPILYIPGLGSIADIATIASLNILGEVAKKTAQYETTLLVPNRDPIVYTVAYEVCKEAYTNVGRPDAFKGDNIFFITDAQFAYAAAVDGIMVREKPATNFFLGMFWAESLILAETGATTGAIQIAGTDAVHQLPFFITACDYTLIGEELYAASAYLSREPLLVGSLKGQDYGKLVILLLVLIGSAFLLLSALPQFKFFQEILKFFSVS
ncbi:MAG: fibronectin type III domain-containing protein [candidate division WOR-3 bacterium]